MRPLNMKLGGNVYEGYLNTIFLAELNLVMSFSIYKSLRKRMESSAKSDLWLSFWIQRCYWVGNSSQIIKQHIQRRYCNVSSSRLLVDQAFQHLAVRHKWGAINWSSAKLYQWWNNCSCAHSIRRSSVHNFRYSQRDGEALPNAD